MEMEAAHMRKQLRLTVLLIAVVCGCGSSGGGGTGGKAGIGATGGNGNAGGAGVGGAGGHGGGTTTGGSSGTDAGLATTCTGGGQVSGGGCNTVEASGPCVTTTTSASAAPSPTGAVDGVAAGTYDLMASTLYVADGGTNHEPARRETLTIGAVTKTSFVLNRTQVSGSSTSRSSGEVTVVAAQVTYDATCPFGEQIFNFSFDATTDTLLFIDPSAQGGTLVSTYVLRPPTADASID